MLVTLLSDLASAVTFSMSMSDFGTRKVSNLYPLDQKDYIVTSTFQLLVASHPPLYIAFLLAALDSTLLLEFQLTLTAWLLQKSIL